MSSFDFITDGMRFSYSSTSSFEGCAYGFKLSYIDAVPKVNNFFAEYGSFIHQCFENYFRGELEAYDLSKYYADNYKEAVKLSPPETLPGLAQKYKDNGQQFFDNFQFPRNDYEILLVEGKLDFEIEGLMFTARPDLLLKHKETKKVSLFDYKTSTPYRTDKRTGKEIADNKKLNGYWKQMFIYTYALTNQMGVSIDDITLWFPRLNRMTTIPWTYEKETEAHDWLKGMAVKIKTAEEFPYDNSSAFFCNNLCGVRGYCEFH